jgi:hypothetical protein
MAHVIRCNRPGCRFCEGDTSQLYCEGCHEPLGPFEPGRQALCGACAAVRAKVWAADRRCVCPPGQRRESLSANKRGEWLTCARCLGIIRRIE